MTNDIAGFGTVITIVASNTFPVGFTITQLADDNDPLDFAPVQIADTSMGVNGDLLAWARAISLPMVVAVIPDGADDTNLQILADANRVAQNKVGANDIITATVVYPDGRVVVRSGGKMTVAPFGTSISSASRKKTKIYSFSFQS